MSRLNILVQQKDRLPLSCCASIYPNWYLWGGQLPRATAATCHFCTSLLSACWCNAEQQIRLAAGRPHISSTGSPVTYQMKTDWDWLWNRWTPDERLCNKRCRFLWASTPEKSSITEEGHMSILVPVCQTNCTQTRMLGFTWLHFLVAKARTWHTHTQITLRL